MLRFIKTAVHYLGVALVFLGVIIMYGSVRANSFNAYILGTGILLVIAPVIAFLIAEKLTFTAQQKTRPVKELKSTGIKLRVDLAKCIVKSNTWTTEVERYENPRVAFLNEISGHSDKNVEKVDSNLSRIEYSCHFNGRRRTFLSPTIAKDEITLTLLIEMQKETAIYVDRDDNRYYYFDLEFIDQ